MSASPISAAKLALAVRKARNEADASLLGSEPIAIVGLACRLPGRAETPEQFWKNLCDGVDAITDPPRGRWPEIPKDISCRAGYLDRVDGFDTEFFDVSPREALYMDPQQRLLLEVTWEALWDAGMDPGALAGSRTGVFTAIYNGYYERMLMNHPQELTAYSSGGTATSTASGRVAFLLDLRGPAVSINTACSSSLVAAHLACQSLRAGDCDMVLAGGVNLKLSSTEMIAAAQMGLLAPDGRAKTFDWRANGFVPGEGCVVSVFKRLSDALAQGDPIRAVIRGTAINQDGRTSTFSAPNALAQAQLIRAAAVNGRVDLSRISFVEAHGTGTALGDPIEIEGLTEALGPHGGDALACVVGSVKTNIGHLEAAAGLAGLAKLVLALENEAIPPNLNFERINPHIQLEGTRFVLPQGMIAWPRGEEPRFCGVSSFGFSGTNAHLILEEAPRSPARRAKIRPREWNRQRYWFVPAEEHSPEPVLEELRIAASTNRVWEVTLPALGTLGQHEVDGQAIVPFTMFLDLLRRAAPEMDLEAIEVHESAVLNAALRVQVVRSESGRIEFFGDCDGIWKRFAQATAASSNGAHDSEQISALWGRLQTPWDTQSHYRALAENGIKMGSAFQTLRELRIGKNEALGRVQIPLEQTHFYRNALLLDGCLQAIAGLVPDAGRFVPVRIEQISSLRELGQRVWAHVRLHGNPTRHAVDFDVTVYNDDGAVVCIMKSVRLRARAASVSDAFYEVAWRVIPPVANGGNATHQKRWLLIGDGDALAQSLGGRGASVITNSEDLNSADEIVLLDAEAPLALDLIQRCAQIGPRGLWFITKNAQRVHGEASLDVAQAGTWGLVRTARREHPELRPVLIDFDGGSYDLLARELLRDSSSEEDQVAYRQGQRYTPRLVRKPMMNSSGWKLEPAQTGLLETISQSAVERCSPGAGVVEVEAQAFGLNFRDVLLALGMYPGQAPLGCEIAGQVVRIGEGVEGLKPGDRVVGVGKDLFGSHVLLDSRQVYPLPPKVDPTDAVALPVAHITARYALDWVGAMKRGDRVLIHAGAGGVGTAAIQQALRAGAEVFATAGNDEKRAYVRSLGVETVFNSRKADYAQAILDLTGGHGVDLVLNSLNGEFHDENLRVLARGGRYLEIGKAGVLSEMQVRAVRPDVRYHVLDWSEVLESDPLKIRGVLQELVEGLATGGDPVPMPKQIFPVEEAAQAFRFMANGRHTGKIVLRVPSPKRIRPDGTYLITGGLGALGLSTAEWLVGRGAGRILLCARRQPAAEVAARIEQMRRRGSQVDVWLGDVAERSVIEGWMGRLHQEGANLRGVIHAAGILADGVIANQTPANLEAVLRPKLAGALHLAELTENRELDFFVLYSSAAALVGAPGQSNYAMANECLNVLAEKLCLEGRQALSIAWGPWESDGMAARIQATDWERALPGVTGWPPARGIQALEQICTGSSGMIAVLRCRWPQARALSVSTRFFDELTGGVAPELPAKQVPLSRSMPGLLEYLERQARQVIGLSDSQYLAADQPLFDAGLDSLAAVEFRNILAAEFGRPLSSTLLFDYPTLHALARFFAPTEQKTAPQVAEGAISLEAEIESLTEGEAAEMLAAELRAGGSR